MAAYAAITSVGVTIMQLRRGHHIASSLNKIMYSVEHEVESLRLVLEEVDDSSGGGERVGALDAQIREAAYELEDSLESHVSDLLLLEEGIGNRSHHRLSLDLQKVRQYVDSFTQKVVKIKEEYIDELTNYHSLQWSQEHDDDDDDDFGGASSSIACFGAKMPKMVGLSDKLSNIKDLLMVSNTGPPSVCIIGMTGTSKTTLAREIFKDPSILHHFACRVWVTVGPTYNFDEITHCILAQASRGNYNKEGNDELSAHDDLDTSSLKHRCLIVLDDVWDGDLYFRLLKHIPGKYNEIRILLTTRIKDIAYSSSKFWLVQETRLMNEEESWDLFREKVFGKDYLCPPELEKYGKEIAKNCEGFAPEIIKLAQLLSKSERIAECWTNVAETRNSVFMVSPRIDSDGKKPVTVGLSADLSKIKDWLIDSTNPLEAISLVGMAGIGKTTLAKEVFEDPLISSHFDVSVWITVGQKYQLKEILRGIAAQVNPGVDIDIDMLEWHLYKSLKDRRNLIVLDDIWDTQILYYLTQCCPDFRIVSKFLVTTELRDQVSKQFFELPDFHFRVHEMHLLNNEESWRLLRQKVFGEESCPFALEKAGKIIAEKCEGLPLTIVTVANLLSKENKTLDHWNEIAATEENSVFCDAYDQISNMLIRSYNYIPRHLKACFLYMGVFSKTYVIPRSNLIMIWSAEGFIIKELHEIGFEELISTNLIWSAEGFTMQDDDRLLEELVGRNLVIVCRQTSSGTTKTCKLHSVFWHMCNRTARKNKLFHALSRYEDGFAEGIESERRLSVRNSVLFRIRDVYNSMVSISALRSLICTGLHYQYSIQICSAWRLLRVLDARTIRFYQFPIEAIKLVRLRYFAITYNGKLPPSISKLQNLEYLIVHRHLRIKFSEDSSYLPVEIWEMRALKHLQVTGSNLPDPPMDALLSKLWTLLDVGARSCTRRILERIPNLVKLGIQIELAHDIVVAPLGLFDICCLHKLKSLKCVITNPDVKIVIPPIFLPSNLQKLTLCDFGYPWQYVTILRSLQNLQVLKLRSYALYGAMWDTYEWKLEALKLLVLEDIDLVHLNGISARIPRLERLIIRHCYKLKGLPSEIGDMHHLKLIELVDCSPLVVDSAEDIKKQWKEQMGYPELEVRIYSS